MFRIEICGGIASGKTTLATEIAAVGNIELVLEKFEEVPFWKKFYENPEVYVFSKNISFQLFHADCVREASASRNGAVCDFAFLQDMSYGAIPPSRKEEVPILRRLHRYLAKSFSQPAAIVHLSCPTLVQIERIRLRGRAAERSIGEDYLNDLNAAITKDVRALAKAKRKPLIIPRDTGAFKLEEYRGVAEQILAQVMDHIGALATSSRS